MLRAARKRDRVDQDRVTKKAEAPKKNKVPRTPFLYHVLVRVDETPRHEIPWR